MGRHVFPPTGGGGGGGGTYVPLANDFDVSTAPPANTKVHAEIDYTTATASDAAYQGNLTLRNVRALVDRITGTVAGPPGLLVAGQAPQPGMRANAYLMPAGPGANGVSAAGLNMVYAWPLYVPYATTVLSFMLHTVTAVAGSSWRVGLYADNGSMYPGARLLDAGTITTTAVGQAVSNASTGDLALPRGIYWGAAKPEGVANYAVRGATGPSWGVPVIDPSPSFDLPAAWIGAGSANALPATFSAFGVVEPSTANICPRVGMRVGA